MSISVVQTLSNRKLAKFFIYGLACAYAALIMLQVLLTSYRGIAIAIILTGLYLARHSTKVLHHPRYHPIAALSPFVEIVLLFLLFMRSGTEIESIVFVLFAADLLLHYKSWYALPFAYGGFIVYTYLWPVAGVNPWQHAFNFLSYTCLVIPIWSTKLLLNQREINLRLQAALVQEAHTREQLAALQERARIAEEVHDTVGHALTTAIVALEGAQLLIDKKPEESLRKIRVAREQLKHGLGNIRQVVRTLKAEEGSAVGLGLEGAIRKIMSDTEKQTGVQLHLRYEVAAQPISLHEYVIINMVKESITNALKHGQASEIDISVQEQQDSIAITVQDNGMGIEDIAYGFGLRTMEDRIRAIGGQLNVRSEPLTGFALHVRMPVAKGEGYE